MDGGLARKIETIAALAASATLALAVGYAAWSGSGQPVTGCVLGAIGFLLCRWSLGRIGEDPRGRLPVFGPEPLELDEVLEQIGSSAGVVRLFNSQTLRSPGELKARIDSHLLQCGAPAAPADASQDLFDALSALRRSLR